MHKLYLQSPAIGKNIAKLFSWIFEIKVEADSGLALNYVKSSLLPDILKEVHSSCLEVKTSNELLIVYYIQNK